LALAHTERGRCPGPARRPSRLESVGGRGRPRTVRMDCSAGRDVERRSRCVRG